MEKFCKTRKKQKQKKKFGNIRVNPLSYSPWAKLKFKAQKGERDTGEFHCGIHPILVHDWAILVMSALYNEGKSSKIAKFRVTRYFDCFQISKKS